MKSLCFALILAILSASTAQAKDLFVRKLVDEKDQSVLFLACQSEQSCSVLGGGSISAQEVESMKQSLLRKHYAKAAAGVGIFTAAFSLNPVTMFSFLTVPTAVITFVGGTAYVAILGHTFETYKHYEIFAEPQTIQHSSEYVIKLINKEILELRAKR